MKNRLLLLSLVLAAIMAISMIPMSMSSAEPTLSFAEPILLDNPDVVFGVEPAKEYCLSVWD